MKAEYIDHMGDDLAVVNAARVSFDKASEWDETCSCGIKRDRDAKYNQWPGCGADQRTCPSSKTRSLKEGDARLIAYLAGHNHWTPFAHTAIKLRMQAPVPIRTQCFKHKFGFVENEESRRYVSTAPGLYVPDVFRMSVKDKKQGSGGAHPYSELFRGEYVKQCRSAIELYEDWIRQGVCPEQARFVLPQGVEVSWAWTGSLAAYARFYRQRTDPHAQLEIQNLAEEVGKIIKPLFPVSWAALTG